MNILVLGNGFDLAHGLPTAYPDFLGFCRMIKAVYTVDKNMNADKLWTELGIKLKNEENTKRLQNMFSELYSMGVVSKDDNRGNIIRTNTVFDELYDDIEVNYWVEYFIQNPMYNKENWIDFESEICNVIKALDKDMFAKDGSKYQFSEEIMINLSNDFLDTYFEEHSFVGQYDGNGNPCGELSYKAIRDTLYRDLNKLTRALEIYLAEYVEKIECNLISPDIKEAIFETRCHNGEMKRIALSKILSFNYTSTYRRLYMNETLKKDFEDFIHGKADICNTIETNNMVLGIDEYLSEDRRNKDVEFIAFKKFYQRIYKKTGCKYREWIETIIIAGTYYEDKLQEWKEELRRTKGVGDEGYLAQKELEKLKNDSPRHNVYIFGHSLDVTDGDILRDLILHDNVHTTIFYYNKDVMGQQIANLVKVIGQDELIKRTGGSAKTIEFK